MLNSAALTANRRSPTPTTAKPAVTDSSASASPRIVGIYNADGGVIGEMKYIAGKVIGQAHCSLCDVTHSPARRKKSWDAMVRTLPYEFVLLHRNELPPNLQQFAAADLPIVVMEDGQNLRVLLSDEQISACDGDPDRLAEALNAAFE